MLSVDHRTCNTTLTILDWQDGKVVTPVVRSNKLVRRRYLNFHIDFIVSQIITSIIFGR